MKGSRGSYLWHSLLEGRKVVEKGAFWRVGDGYRIDAWRDAWLNKSPGFKPLPPDQIEPTALRVTNLIDQDRRIWKHDMIREIFTETDGTNISSIHLSREKIPDKLIWRSLIIGEFTVRSAYYVTRQILEKEVPNATQRHKVWGFLWTANVSPKIKFFAWRLIFGILLVCDQLVRKGVQVENRCLVCGTEGETLLHIFYECRFSNEV